ncbi:hypothetical protein FQA39_LY19348 [Lamprigera yunnana]|nr:hypothetical protein FQA39_LY19348 [Lamprigera yunnana]
MVGVANGHSTITPCNAGLQKLADAAIAGIEESGGNAQVFGTPTISDGMAMGTEGMKFSALSPRGRSWDGRRAGGGRLRQETCPPGMMGMLRANVPRHLCVRRHHPGPATSKGARSEASPGVVRGRGRERPQAKLSDADLKEIESAPIPATGSCGGMYTWPHTNELGASEGGLSAAVFSTMAQTA